MDPVKENWPSVASHTIFLDFLVSGQAKPPSQRMQLVALTSLYVPSGHFAGNLVAELGHMNPSGQEKHIVMLPVELYIPAGQGIASGKFNSGQ